MNNEITINNDEFEHIWFFVTEKEKLPEETIYTYEHQISEQTIR
jgi:hypothetical protein